MELRRFFVNSLTYKKFCELPTNTGISTLQKKLDPSFSNWVDLEKISTLIVKSYWQYIVKFSAQVSFFN